MEKMRPPKPIKPWEPTWLPVVGPQWFVVDQNGTLLRKRHKKGLMAYPTRDDAVKACTEINDVGEKKP